MSKLTPNIPYEKYRALAGVNISTLKEIARSPMHYKHRLENPKQSTALRLGTAAHTATLEPERFIADYAIWDRVTDGGNAAPRRGQWWDAFCAENADKEIINFNEHLTAKNIAKSIRSNPDAMKYLATGYPEVIMECEMRGRQCKGRIDWISKVDGGPVIVGIKTTRDVREFQFARQAAQLGYHLQWAWYYDMYATIKQGLIPKMVEIVVENGDVPAVAVYVITDETIDQGRKEYMKLLERLAECEAKNDWPGPFTGEQALLLPSWAYDEQEIEVEGEDNG